MKKLMLLFVTFFASSLFASLAAPLAANAATPGKYLDMMHILVNGKTYTDYKFDKTWEYSLSNGCSDTISNFANGTDGRGTLNNPVSATLSRKQVNQSNGDCNEVSNEKITFDSTYDQKSVFVWKDKDTLLDTTKSSVMFVRANPTSSTFLSTDATDGCKSELTFGSDVNQSKLIVRVTKDRGLTSSPNILNDTHYADEPMPFKLSRDLNETQKCYEIHVDKNSPVRVAHVENATKNAGAPDLPGGGGTSGGDGGGQKDDACAQASGAYGWALCPAFVKIGDFLDGVYKEIIKPLLEVTPLTTTSKDGSGKSVPNPIFLVWQSFVQLADILFVVAFLILIFGTTLNLDSYTVKKALPRLVIAAIAVQISYFLCGILIDIGNIFGDGLMQLIATAAKSATNSSDPIASQSITLAQKALGVGSVGVGLLASAAAVTILGPTIIFLALGFLLAVFTFIVTLLVRQVVINVLILLAPLAFVAWVLPNTEVYFKKWRDNFVKIIMVYPAISFVLGATFIVQAASVGQTFIVQLIGGVTPIIGYFLMPKVFKMAGAAMGVAGGAIGKIGARGNSKLQNSQLKKDTIANSKGKAAQKYMNPDTGTFGKATSMLRNGAFLPSAASRRRLATSAATYSKTQGDEVQNQFERANGGAGLSQSQLGEIVGGKDSGGVKANAVSRDKAIAQLAAKSDWGRLRNLQAEQAAKYQQQGMTKEAAQQKAQTDFTAGLRGTEAFTKARDLIQPPDQAFSAVTGSVLAKMHHSTLAAHADQIRSMAPGAEKDAASIRFAAAAKEALSTPQLRSDLSLESSRQLYEAANGAAAKPAVAATSTTAAQAAVAAKPAFINGSTSSVNARINSDGTLK